MLLYYTILHYTTLYYSILYCAVLRCATLHYTTLHYTILYYTILYYTILLYTILYYTTLYYTTLHYTTLHYTTLNYTKALLVAEESDSSSHVSVKKDSDQTDLEAVRNSMHLSKDFAKKLEKWVSKSKPDNKGTGSEINSDINCCCFLLIVEKKFEKAVLD